LLLHNADVALGEHEVCSARQQARAADQTKPGEKRET
jgi:hypothetical protein